MTEQQLYLAVGLPVVAILIGILVNVTYFGSLSSRIGSLEARFDNRMSSLETKVDTKFDLLTGKVIELDNRLSRLEERLKH